MELAIFSPGLVAMQTNRKRVIKKVVSQIENPQIDEKKQKQIVAAASELFSKKGYHATSMREIAATSGINLSYLYKCISSKDDILYLFYEHLHHQWDHYYYALKTSVETNPVEQLKEWIRSMLEIIQRFNDEILTMYTESRHLEPDSIKAVLSKESEMVQALEALIIRGVESGYFKTKDTFMTANIIHYMISIAPLRGWNFLDRYTFTRFVELITDSVFCILGINETDKK